MYIIQRSGCDREDFSIMGDNYFSDEAVALSAFKRFLQNLTASGWNVTLLSDRRAKAEHKDFDKVYGYTLKRLTERFFN